MISKHQSKRLFLGVIITLSSHSVAGEVVTYESYEQCLVSELKKRPEYVTLKLVREDCQTLHQSPKKPTKLLAKRMEKEREVKDNPFVISPNKMNYVLPVSVTDSINSSAYKFHGWDKELKNIETKFQFSFKVPLSGGDIFVHDDGLFFGFTTKSWFQVYTENISKQFRETNYQPSLFYVTPLSEIEAPFNGDTWLILGLEHESNGRSQELSRSWNRAFAVFAYEQENFVISLRPWWRFPEKTKANSLSPDGDDNPTILSYMGHFELTSLYKWNDYNFSFLGRRNFEHGKGFVEIGFTFPLWGQMRGFIQYCDGWGESLIDFDHRQRRLGLGVALTDLF